MHCSRGYRVRVWQVICVLLVALAGFGCTALVSPREEKSREHAIADLARIGEGAVRAVFTRDLESLMRYSRAAVREDVATTETIRRNLQVYLFRDVDRVLRSARQLAIRVVDGGDRGDGIRSAELVFYDRARISDAVIEDPLFLCWHDLVDAVAWTFDYFDGRWESIGYPFDAFTDIHCPP